MPVSAAPFASTVEPIALGSQTSGSQPPSFPTGIETEVIPAEAVVGWSKEFSKALDPSMMVSALVSPYLTSYLRNSRVEQYVQRLDTSLATHVSTHVITLLSVLSGIVSKVETDTLNSTIEGWIENGSSPAQLDQCLNVLRARTGPLASAESKQEAVHFWKTCSQLDFENLVARVAFSTNPAVLEATQEVLESRMAAHGAFPLYMARYSSNPFFVEIVLNALRWTDSELNATSADLAEELIRHALTHSDREVREAAIYATQVLDRNAAVSLLSEAQGAEVDESLCAEISEVLWQLQL